MKTRVPSEVKAAFEELAAKRHLDVADITREAFRQYLERQSPGLRLARACDCEKAQVA